MKRIRLARFEERSQAESACQSLQEAGIKAEIHAESSFAKLWFVPRSGAGLNLEVPLEQAHQAAELLIRWDGCEPWLEHVTRCPECKSFQVNFPQFTEKSILTNVTIGLLAGLGLIERQYYCEECHFMWTRGSKVVRLRPHSAPNYFLEDLSEEEHTRRFQNIHEEAADSKPARPGRNSQAHLRTAAQWRIALSRQFRGLGIILMLGALGDLKGAERPAPPLGARPERQAPGVSSGPTYVADVLPIFMGKCARCHNEQSILANWLDYHTASAKRWEIKRRVWDSWHGTYYKQPMPAANGAESGAMSEQERQLIRDWVESGAQRGAEPVYTGRLSKAEKVEIGRRLFATICAACHQPTGQGIPGRFPPLASSDFLNADKHRAIQIVVNGLQGDLVVNGQHFNNAMPKFPLSDQDIACALTFVYSSFGNSGKEVSPEEVTAVRQEKGHPELAPLSTTKAPEEKSPYE